MNKIIVTTLALSATALMSGCGGSDGDGSPPGGAGADPISIVTVTGKQHVLTGDHATACYVDSDGNGRIDVLTVTGAQWTNESNIYLAVDCTGGINRTGKIIANIAGANSDTQTSGWIDGQGDGVSGPERADATGSLSNNETVTPFDIEVTSVIDPTQLFGGNVSRGFKATAFYVFDDTAGGDTYIMYRDDDGDFASTTDPYVQGTVGTGGGSGSQLIYPVTAISGAEFEMSSTSWGSDCIDLNNTNDAKLFLVVSNSPEAELTTTRELYATSDGTCSSGFPTLTTTSFNTVLAGVTSNISGWVDTFGFSVSAPQRQDNAGQLSDSESMSDITATVASTNDNQFSVGQAGNLGYVVDDSASPIAIYRLKGLSGINAEQTPLFLQLQ